MTTAPDHHEPLDQEERDLAARLGRIGPFDGPSPALDAKILAAAHAAAVRRTPGRRLAWLGVPPALVTGVGVAAAAVLALGLVWQLRPQPGMVASHSEADAGEEVILIATPTDASPASVANPPPLPEDATAPPARAQAAAAPAQASRDNAERADAPQAEAAAARESTSLAGQAAAAEEKRETAAIARDAASDAGFVPEPPAAPASNTAYRRATYTTAARARAEERQRMANKAAVAAAAPAAAPSADAASTASAEADTLDRIEVTGTRIAQAPGTDWSQVPTRDDTRLAAAEWLERIRARRDGGDTDNARASLRLFQREHPRVRLPDDLRELLAEAKR